MEPTPTTPTHAITQPQSQSDVLRAIAQAQRRHQADVTHRRNAQPTPARTEIPEVRFVSFDPSQGLKYVSENSFRIEGTAAQESVSKSLHVIRVDRRVVKIPLVGGETPLVTAFRIRDSLPSEYMATVRAGRPATAWAVVSIWRQDQSRLKTC